MSGLRERFEAWALANDKPYDRLTPWAACEMAYRDGAHMALTMARDAQDEAGESAAARMIDRLIAGLGEG